MAFKKINDKCLSDLVVHEADPSVGKSRRVIALPATTDFKLGTVVYRAKAAAKKGETAYAPITIATDAQFNTGVNEYAVVFGDAYGFNPEFKTPATDPKGVAFVHDVILKDAEIIAANNVTLDGTDDDNWATLLACLERQGIVVEKTLG